MPPRTRTPAPAPSEDPAPGPDRGGWFRNTGPVELTVLAESATAVLAPGRIAPLPRTPTHRDLTAATEADYRAQQAADAEAAPPSTAAPENTEA